MPANQGRGYAAGMSSPELARRVDAHEEDLRAISDTAIEIRDDVAYIKTEHGRLLVLQGQMYGRASLTCDDASPVFPATRHFSSI